MKPVTTAILIFACFIFILVIVASVLLAQRPVTNQCAWLTLPCNTNQPIPRIIHQTWKTKDLPPNFARWSKSCRDLTPHFEYKLWTDEDNRNLIKDHYPWFLPTYDGYDKHIKRVDAARYFILHRYGGLYLDLDFICLRKFEHLLKDGHAVFGKDGDQPLNIPNAWMACPPKHPLFHILIHSLRQHRHKPVLSATGPTFLAKCIQEFRKKEKDVKIILYKMPLIYSHQWNKTPKGIESCKLHPETCKELFPNSFFTTIWTHTWK